MFNHVEIHLDNPICNCHQCDFSKIEYSWAIDIFSGKGTGLTISCKKCNTKLCVSHEKFVGRFVFPQQPPPKGKHPAPKEDKKDNVVSLKAVS